VVNSTQQMNLHLLQHIPEWLGSHITAITAWVALIVTVRRELLEWVHLKFTLKITHIDEDDVRADVHQVFDGVPVVDAVLMRITNEGRGITIEQCQCEYLSSFSDGVRAVKITAHIGEYIGQGKACEGRLKIYAKPIRFTSAVAIDSTGRTRKCSRRELKRLNDESALWWSKQLFEKQASPSDKRLAEKRRAKQKEMLKLESTAAQQATKKHERESELKLKLYNVMRRIDCIECDFQFPPGAGAVFNVTLIRQINHGLESIQDHLIELADLPETNALLGMTISCPANTSASWSELGEIYKADFLPVQNTYRTLKNEVLRVVIKQANG
jgi:hypothetical protein